MDLSENLNRPSWNKTFMDECELHSMRSTCLRRNVGAVAVRDKRVLATGYNGAPPGHPHCATCIREQLEIPSGQRAELCKGLHAEQNLIIQAAKFGINLSGSTIYCTTAPCSICMKMLVSINFEKIIYKDHYNDSNSVQIANNCGYKYIKGIDFFEIVKA